jgi:cytochrome P450
MFPVKNSAPTNMVLTLPHFRIAGTHTTSATTALLFYHLLHSPEIMAKCVAEIDENLPALHSEEDAYSVTQVETSLPFLRNCVKENSRITPVFTMPLARRVLIPGGLTIAGYHIPQYVSLNIVLLFDCVFF